MKKEIVWILEHKAQRQGWLEWCGYNDESHCRYRLKELDTLNNGRKWRIIKQTTTTRVERRVVK